jgi:hypothetical protein
MPATTARRGIAWDTVAGDVVAGDVVAGDVVAGDVVAGDVVAGDVVAGDVVADDVVAWDMADSSSCARHATPVDPARREATPLPAISDRGCRTGVGSGSFVRLL